MKLATRQSGKTEACVLRACHVAHTEPNETIVVVSPSQRICNEFVRRARARYFRLEGAKLVGDAVQKLEFENGSRILALPGDRDGDTIRRIARVRLVLIDEAARVSDELYAATRPMLAVHPRGELIGLTTGHLKKGWFYEAWTDPVSDFEKIRITADMCPRLTPEFLASESKALGENAFPVEILNACFDPNLKALWS